jgi:hypothetical protein
MYKRYYKFHYKMRANTLFIMKLIRDVSHKIPVSNTSTAKIFGVGTVTQVINGFAPIVVDPTPPAFLK